MNPQVMNDYYQQFYKTIRETMVLTNFSQYFA